MKLFFFDTETTGTDYQKHGIHQLSGIVVIDGIEKERFNIKIVPWNDCEYTDEALKVTGKTLEEIKAYPNTEQEAMVQILEILDKYVKKFNKKDKFYMVGYNVHFDNQMLRALFIRCFENYFGSYFWSNPIDVMTLASIKLLSHRSYMDNFQLMTVAKTLGLLEGKDLNFHDALFDVEITKDIYDFLLLEKEEKSFEPIKEELKQQPLDKEKALNLLDDICNTPQPVKINTDGMKSLKKINSDNLNWKLGFGKYRETTYKILLDSDPQYLLWISDNLIQGIKFSDDILEEIRKNADIQKSKNQRNFGCPSLGSGNGYYHSAGSQESLESFGACGDEYPF